MNTENIESFRRAIQKKIGLRQKSRGRPPKKMDEKYQAISIRLHPRVLEWAKKEAKKTGLKYQTVINKTLLKLSEIKEQR